MRTASIIIIFVLSLIRHSVAEDVDTVIAGNENPDSVSLDSTGEKSLIPPSQELLKDPDPVELEKFNPFMSVGLSTVLPGIGQLYCKRTFRGLFYMTSEAIAMSYMFNRIYVYDKYSADEIDTWSIDIGIYEELLKTYISTAEYDEYYDLLITAHMELDLAKHRQMASRYVVHQSIGWAVGIYLWNISDALNCSRAFHDNKPRNPATALSLSAIPFLGLGQIYNGSFSKAGLIWTFHTMWAFMAWNNNNLMNDCLKKRNQVNNATGIDQTIKDNYYTTWTGEYDRAFSKRNSYLWYLIIFWFYGMFDAAIDAHLHDYQSKIRLEPKVEINDETLGFKMHVNF